MGYVGTTLPEAPSGACPSPSPPRSNSAARRCARGSPLLALRRRYARARRLSGQWPSPNWRHQPRRPRAWSRPRGGARRRGGTRGGRRRLGRRSGPSGRAASRPRALERRCGSSRSPWRGNGSCRLLHDFDSIGKMSNIKGRYGAM